MLNRAGLVIALVVCLSQTGVWAQDAFGPLLSKLPDGVNTLVMIDVEALFASPMAVDGDWRTTMKASQNAQAVRVPDNAVRFVLASNTEPTSMQTAWLSAAAQMQGEVSVQAIAQREGGHTDKLGSLDAAWSPRDFYVVGFGANLLAAISPANRQTAVRWVNQAVTRSSPNLSPYLTQVAAMAQASKSQFMVAMDIEGVLSVSEILPELGKFKSLPKSANTGQIASLVAGAKGACMLVNFTDKARGRFIVQFTDPAAPIQDFAGPFVREVMRNAGVEIIELNNWETRVEGNTVTLEGELLDSGMRRLRSFVQVPLPSSAAPAASAKESEDPAAASQKYFKAVNAFLVDARAVQDASQLSSAAVWMDRHARQIEQLPILGVDPMLQDWSAFVSGQLRVLSQRLRGVQYRSATRMAEHNNFYDTKDSGGSPTATLLVKQTNSNYGNYYGDGGYNQSEGYERMDIPIAVERYRQKYQEAERRGIGQQEQASGRQDAGAIVAEIDQETARVRREMVKKYNVEF